MPSRGCCDSVVGFVERQLTRAFDKYARFLTKHPLWFIVGPILLTFCLLPGLVRYNYVYDSVYLYTPVEGPAKDERDVMEDRFPNNETHLYITTRKLDVDGFLQVLVLDSSSADNIFTEIGLEKLLMVDEMIRNFTTTDDDGDVIQFADVCSKWQGSCEGNEIISLLESQPLNNVRIQYPFNNDTFLGQQLGGVEVDADGYVTAAQAAFLSYNTQYQTDEADDRSTAWLGDITDVLLDMHDDDVTVVLQNSNSLDEELEAATQEIIPLFAVTYNILCIFSLLTCMMFDWIRSKMWIALAGQVAAGLAIASAIGFNCAVGVPFASICSTMPFLLMGIGIDNMFVIVAVWRDTAVRHSVPDRMGETFSKAAVSITLTSITDCLAFGIGAISPFRSVQFFCAYAGVACAFCYVYSITFLAACLVYAGRREERNTHICACRQLDPQEVADSMPEENGWTAKRVFCYGSAVNHDDGAIPLTNGKAEKGDVTSKQSKNNPLNVPEKVLPYLTHLIEHQYAKYLLKTPVKLGVLLSYCAYIGVAIWGCTELQQGLELQNLAPDDSYLGDFYDVYNPLFNEEYSGRIMVAITETLDYTNENDLQRIEALVQSFQDDARFFDDPRMLEFWLRDFQTFLNVTSQSPANMIQFIDILQNQFLSLPGPDRYVIDLEFSPDNSQITASRFLIQALGVKDTTEEAALLEKSRELADDSSIDTTVYFNAFVYWDQYIVILVTTLTNLGIAVACVLVVAFLLVPSLNAVAMVALSICSICVGVIGYMTLWDVNLDSVSMINLVLCIGFSVDFSAHICYHFSISAEAEAGKKDSAVTHTAENSHAMADRANNGHANLTYDSKFDSFNDTPRCNKMSYDVTSKQVHIDDIVDEKRSAGDEKATEALSQLGMPILQGALSTILAVSVLSTSNTYIFRTFFKVIFLVMCFGFYHAMILLPVVLSFFHDLCCGSKEARAASRSVSPTMLPERSDVNGDVRHKNDHVTETRLSREYTGTSDAKSSDSGISAHNSN